jgi:hypothetical protein
MRHIHLTCLKELLKSKMNMKTSDFYTACTWQNVECELCKTKLPDTVEITYENGNMRDSYATSQETSKMISLLEVPEDVQENPYIMMECLNASVFKKKTTKIIYFVKLKSDKLILGRGQAANVRLADISISRTHTTLHFTKNNELYITDSGSKFGTLILQKEPIELDPKK